MSRRKKKASSGEQIDRISELPSNVIDVILQHLPIQDLVKTSLLSRKWRYTWSSISRLKFEYNNFFHYCTLCGLDYHETSSIITEVLFLHNGPLQNFTLQIHQNLPIKMECVVKWILFLSRKGIKELKLMNLQTAPCQTPTHIFSCQDLTYLYLENFKLSTVTNFHGFKSLVELHLFNITFESGALEGLMSDSLSLVTLFLWYCNGLEHINVFSPILQTLQVEGKEFIKLICLKEAQNLVYLTLWADRDANNIDGHWVSDLMKDLLKIETLDLGGGYIKILSAMNPRVLLSSVTTLKRLILSSVNFNEAEVLFVISLLECSPNLEEVVIESYDDDDGNDLEEQISLKNFDYCCFSKLQFVNITVQVACNHVLNLIKFLLAKSLSLKILTLKVDRGLNQSYAPILSISSDLLKMKRASPKAEVEFLYGDL